MSGGLHKSVLRDEVVAALAPRDGATLVDGTFGAGGYTRALLAAARCRVFAIDRDPRALVLAAAVQAEFPDRFQIIEGCFGEMAALLDAVGVTAVDGIALDIGVSSMQIDEAERGFSFQADGPLDMRMSQTGPTAADLVNTLEEGALADLIYQLGEDRKSRRIARAIVTARRERPITRTGELAAVVARVVRAEPGHHPATRTFQALRIAVNDELGELQRGLCAAERLLVPGGRLAVVSFHSLEDRIVKRFLDRRAGRGGGGSRHLPQVANDRAPSFELIDRGGRVAGAAETRANPRARSARLRAAVRTAAPIWPAEEEIAA